MRGSVLVVAVVAVLGLTACSEQPPEVAVNDQVPADQRVVEATDGEEGGGGGATGEVTGRFVGNQSLEFTEAPSELPAGPNTLELVIEGALPHDVTFEGVNNDNPVVAGDTEGTYTGNVTLDAGDYVFYCSVPGHREAGMEGTLTVVEGGGGGGDDGGGEATEPAEDGATETA